MVCPDCIEDGIVSKCAVEIKFKELKGKFLQQDEKVSISFEEYLMLDYLKLSQKLISFDYLSDALDIPNPSLRSNMKKLIDKDMCEIDMDVSKKINS